jgi:ribosomal protein S18 acetylase RimI-like enzyme
MSDYFEDGREFLEHFGVKGMKWGVRKDRGSQSELKPLLVGDVTRTLSNGDSITLSPQAPGKLNKSLAKISKTYRKNYENGSYLTIKGKDGKKIGEANFWNKDKDDIYLNWVRIEKSSRGRGYATEVMKSAGEHGKASGKKRLVLEVPGKAPDARHIYEKMGFKETRVISPADDLWGGLTEMEYRLDQKERR